KGDWYIVTSQHFIYERAYQKTSFASGMGINVRNVLLLFDCKIRHQRASIAVYLRPVIGFPSDKEYPGSIGPVAIVAYTSQRVEWEPFIPAVCVRMTAIRPNHRIEIHNSCAGKINCNYCPGAIQDIDIKADDILLDLQCIVVPQDSRPFCDIGEINLS